jgi:hypothetical protein
VSRAMPEVPLTRSKKTSERCLGSEVLVGTFANNRRPQRTSCERGTDEVEGKSEC